MESIIGQVIIFFNVLVCVHDPFEQEFFSYISHYNINRNIY